MNAFALILTLLFSALVFLLPRHRAALAVVAGVCYLTQGQVENLGGFHFTAIRMVLLAGFLRVMARGELQAVRMTPMDRMLLLFVLMVSALLVLRVGTFKAAVGQLGYAYNVLGAYFLFRALLPGRDDFERFLPELAWVILPAALFMLVEESSGRNLFSAFGGPPEIVELRDGHYRCQEAFRSPITAGTLGATLVPLFIGLYLTGQARRNAILGIAAATTIVICSRSSGPLIALLSGALAWAFWRRRGRLNTIRWVVILALVGLHMVMKAPVWFLMARVSDLVGGGGWHRAEIIDQTVNHFGSWWLMGTDETGDWMATQLRAGGADLTNQFVAAAVNGGLLAMVLFIWFIVRAFNGITAALRVAQESFLPDTEKILWALGAALFATVVNFFSVSYFDQIEVIWYLLAAAIAGVTADVLAAVPAGAAAAEDFSNESGFSPLSA